MGHGVGIDFGRVGPVRHRHPHDAVGQPPNAGNAKLRRPKVPLRSLAGLRRPFFGIFRDAPFHVEIGLDVFGGEQVQLQSHPGGVGTLGPMAGSLVGWDGRDEHAVGVVDERFARLGVQRQRERIDRHAVLVLPQQFLQKRVLEIVGVKGRNWRNHRLEQEHPRRRHAVEHAPLDFGPFRQVLDVEHLVVIKCGMLFGIDGGGLFSLVFGGRSNSAQPDGNRHGDAKPMDPFFLRNHLDHFHA